MLSITPSNTAILPVVVDPDYYCPNSADIMAAARAYVAAGLSVLPIARGGSKSPASWLLPGVYDERARRMRHPWKPYKFRRPTEAELLAWFGSCWPVYGLAVIGGGVSGGLEILDFDSFDAVEPWANLVRQQNPQLLDRLVLVQTPRPGLHAYYRCPTAAKNRKLAQKCVVDTDLLPSVKTLIETKAEGGYALVPPSPPECHPSRRPYLYRSLHDLRAVPMITVEERNLLVDAARSFDAMPATMRVVEPASSPRSPRQLDPTLPGDDFEMRADWNELLIRHGWTLISADGDGMQHWCRPGKSNSTSATLNHAGAGLLHVFTSSAVCLEADKSYTKLSFLVAVEFGGDFQAALRQLRQQGYGQPRQGWALRRQRLQPRSRRRQ